MSASPPLWRSQLAGTLDDAIGFRDLLELRFVREFRKAGVSLQAIRRAAECARELLGADHPFTCQRFQTDGRSIFVTIHEATGDETLVDIVARQQVFDRIIRPSLYSGIEFGETGADRWFPSQSKAVVMDPNRSFGQPIVVATGTPTAALYEAVEAEGGDDRMVANIFEVSLEDVRAAVAFEKRIRLH